MTESVDVTTLERQSTVFRLEIADFGDFYERTYSVAYRTALGIVREPALAGDTCGTLRRQCSSREHLRRESGDGSKRGR